LKGKNGNAAVPGLREERGGERIARIATITCDRGDHPRVLGALLHAVVRALGAAEVAVPPQVRMLAPAGFAARAAPALGLDANAIVRAYLESRESAHGVMAEDAVIGALLGFLVPPKRSTWVGTMEVLLEELDRRRAGRSRATGWPETPRGLSAALRCLAPTLRELGVVHTHPAPSDKTRTHRFARNP
jgi:hypothetical protein